MNNKELYQQLLKIAIPVAIQSMLGFFVNLLDTVMLGQLGEVQISASSLSNQIFFILSLLIYGIVGGSNVLVAQYWGQRNKKTIHSVLAYTYRIGLLAAAVLMGVGLLFPSQTLSLFTKDTRVISEGAAYLRIVCISYIFYAFTTITTGTLRAIRDVRISVMLSAVSLVINGSLNYLLIFGKAGLPALGIKGAAIATLITRLIEMLLLLLYLALKEKELQIRIGKLLHLDKMIGQKYFSNTTPVILNELFWSVGSTVLAMIMGHMGTEFVAANSIFNGIGQVASVFAQGLNAAGAVMIGNVIGGGGREKVLWLKRQLQFLGLVSGIVTALLILLLKPFVFSLYDVSEQTVSYAVQIVYTGAFVQVFKTAQGMNMMGILRGGGDARFVMVNDIIFLWLLAVPLGFLAGLVWKLPVPVTYCLLNIEQFIKFFTSSIRLRNNKWIKNVTT